PIMEDFDLVRRLAHRGRIIAVPESAVTSGRRWQTLGLWRTTWIHQRVIASYLLGQSPEIIAARYRQACK
ncbi:MAG: glycosyltransferase, partial [Verrucomicrobia bacterium]|nr:glycosyltransferase [Verrucomicrobiota bacterium]